LRLFPSAARVGPNFPHDINQLPIDGGATRWDGAVTFTLAWLDKPLRLTGAVKTAKVQIGGEALQSLLQMSRAPRV